MVGPLEVIPTPGHTDGHVAFFHPSDNVLIVGDAVATWPKFGAGWPGFNHDEEEYQASLKSLLAMGAKVIGTGHGDPISRANTPQMAARLRMLSPRAPVTPPEPTARTGWRRLLARFGGPGSGGG